MRRRNGELNGEFNEIPNRGRKKSDNWKGKFSELELK